VEYTASLPRTRVLPARLASRVDLPGISAWTLAFTLVTYLAMRNGGYDTIVRSEVGVAIWWIVLLAALGGLIPFQIARRGWVAIGMLGAFCVWTAIAVAWSVSVGDTVTEIGREATYLAVLVLAIALQGRTAARHMLNGVASAIGLVTVLAVVSRLHPQWFPANDDLQLLGAGSTRRLSYPLNYWNALAAFTAIGVPLLVCVAISARHVALRALAASVLPLSALCIYLTLSRGGVLELGVGVVVLMILIPRRLQATATLLVGGAGSAILILGAANRSSVRSGLQTPSALHHGSELLLLALVVCAGVALLQAALALADQNFVAPAWARPSRRTVAIRAAALAAAIVIAVVAAGVPGKVAADWRSFKAPVGVVVPANDSTVFSRLSAVNGNGRYQFWVAALHANATRPLTGIGPGTFAYWWAAHATTNGSVQNAHSLYFETLAEAGIIGLALIGGLLLWFVAVGVARSLSAATSTTLRIAIAGATAGLVTFMTAAAIEWVWQMAAIAAIALLLGAVIVAGREHAPGRPLTPVKPPFTPRAIATVLAVAGLIAVAIPLAAAVALSDSHSAAAAGNLVAAYHDSLTAERIEPYAAAPRQQEALVLEAAGDLRPAATAAQLATKDAPTDWSVWMTLAGIEARRGANAAALSALHRAEALNPRYVLWQGQP
jgi:O-antigen ligase